MILVICAVTAAAQAESTVLYVNAQGGSDDAAGTAAQPFASLDRARDALRELKRAGAFPASGAVIELTGVFDLSIKTFELSAGDGGLSPAAPVVYRAGPKGALLTGGRNLPAGGFRTVTDPQTLARLPERARGKVVEFDLKAAGIGPFMPLPDKFAGWNEQELFSSGTAMRLARWPNEGWAEIAKVIDRGVKPIDRKTGEWEFGYKGGTFEYAEDAPSRWNVETGIWMNGFWCHDWANETLKIAAIDKDKKRITAAAVHTYGIGNSSSWHKAKRRYYVFNLLEELDAPGEWYIDRARGVLYFFPRLGDLGDVVLAVQKKPLVSISSASHIHLEGLAFRYSTGLAISVQGCRGVALRRLRVSDLTGTGLVISGGTACGIDGCEVCRVGGTCLAVSGGDRKTLSPCGHYVTGCRLHHCGRLQRTHGKCLNFSGVGIRVAHNLIHDSPYIAVQYGGNDNIFESNEVHSAMMESGDGGGLYTGRDWGSQGNIVRNNYFHHFGQPGVDWQKACGLNPDYEPLRENVMVMGVYLDDCDSGDAVCNNIFYRTGWSAFVGGGRYNTISNNLFIACTAAIHLDDRGLTRARPGEGTQDGWDLLAKLQTLNWQQPPWCDRYPHLVNVMQDEPKLPLHNVFACNVAVNCQRFLQMHGTVKDTALSRLDFRDNLAFGVINKADEAAFPQTKEGQRRVTFRSETLPGSDAPDRDGFSLQDASEFRLFAPWFRRISIEKAGLSAK